MAVMNDEYSSVGCGSDYSLISAIYALTKDCFFCYKFKTNKSNHFLSIIIIFNTFFKNI